jgi:hypothetical protein
MPSRRSSTVGALFAVLVVSGCECNRPNKADGGESADGGDAGRVDAGADAGQPDAGQPDAGQPDAGLQDGGPPDAGPSDAGADAGSGDAGPPDSGAPDSGLPFCEAYLRSVCAWNARCGTLDPAQSDDCVALSRWSCSQPQLDAVFDAGKVYFASAQVPICLQKLTASSCARSYPGAAECNGLFAPATAVGGQCTRQWSTFCAASYCKGDTCPAQCESFIAVDAGCNGDEGDQCGPYAYCPQQQPRVCTAYLSPGATCTNADRCGDGTCDTAQARCLAYGSQTADAGCGSDSVCRDDLYCKSGACTVREVQGGPCRLYGGSDCAPGFTCRITDAGTNGTCAPSEGLDGGCYGLPNDCLPGLLCDNPALLSPGHCLGLGSEGVGCNYALQNCKVGLLCDAVTKLCRRLPKVGELCVRDPGNFRSSDCVDGFCPSADAGARCAAPQIAGASCERPWECASTECSNGICAALCTTF